MNDPRDAEFEGDEANTRLVAGLKSCRSVVESYRSMLSGDHGEAANDADPNGFDSQQGTAP